MESALSTDDILATVKENNKNLLEITQAFKSITRKIDGGKGLLAALVNNPAMANTVNGSLNNLHDIMANLKTSSSASEVVLVNLKNFTGKLNTPGNSINDLAADTIMYKSATAYTVF